MCHLHTERCGADDHEDPLPRLPVARGQLRNRDTGDHGCNCRGLSGALRTDVPHPDLDSTLLEEFLQVRRGFVRPIEEPILDVMAGVASRRCTQSTASSVIWCGVLFVLFFTGGSSAQVHPLRKLPAGVHQVLSHRLRRDAKLQGDLLVAVSIE